MSPTPLTGGDRGSRLLAQEHVATPILLVAGLIMFITEGTVLAVRDDRYLLWIHPKIDQDILRRLGPFLPKDEVVVVCPSLVTVAGYLE